MEMQFKKEVRPCLRWLISHTVAQEQTQEVRLPDGMPDIGRVLGAWGQVLIRGKEWRGDTMTVTGGVLCWALYAPEDGSEARSVDTWIPFSMKWDLPDTQRDGIISVWPLLNSVDARCVSARKLMLRCNISVHGEAMEPVTTETYDPSQVPEDVQLLKQTYPMELPLEAGEKQFLVQEELTTGADIHQILRQEANAWISEHRVMANRLVFRGNLSLHLVYRDPEGRIVPWDTEIPFSQYTELDGNYSDSASASILPIVTAMELERDENGGLLLKCGIAAQYVICDRVLVDTVEDAYSPFRVTELQTHSAALPARLDIQQEGVRFQGNWSAENATLLDAVLYCEHPEIVHNGDRAQLRLPGRFQLLYTDEEGMLQGCSVKAEAKWETEAAQDSHIRALCRPEGQWQAAPGVNGIELAQEWKAVMETFSDGELTMVSGLRLGELQEADPMRPALVLRRAGRDRLWDIAKDCGSTVEAIEKANGLTQMPDDDRMLLIPIL